MVDFSRRFSRCRLLTVCGDACRRRRVLRLADPTATTAARAHLLGEEDGKPSDRRPVSGGRGLSGGRCGLSGGRCGLSGGRCGLKKN